MQRKYLCHSFPLYVHAATKRALSTMKSNSKLFLSDDMFWTLDLGLFKLRIFLLNENSSRPALRPVFFCAYGFFYVGYVICIFQINFPFVLNGAFV